MGKAFAKLEVKLTSNKYFGSDKLGMVDISWLPLLHRAAIIEKYSGYDFLGPFEKVKKLQQDILATGLAERSVSVDFEEKFSAFYLSEDTYLGQCAKAKMGQACCGNSECTDSDFECCS